MWQAALDKGVFEGAEVDRADGYIHFSTAQQLEQTAAKHFAGQNDLVLISIESATLGKDLRWEPSRGGDLFPHLYAHFTPQQIHAAHPLPLSADGEHDFGDLLT
jgi:uncharacterized protein (DUF952 family)